jgi:hypothetical protein
MGCCYETCAIKAQGCGPSLRYLHTKSHVSHFTSWDEGFSDMIVLSSELQPARKLRLPVKVHDR